MNLKSIKTIGELPFRGIEFVKVDNNITEVVFGGGRLRIRKGEAYSPTLQVLLEQEHQVEDRYRVTAEQDGFDPKVTYFDGQYAADQAVGDYERNGAKAAAEKVKVLIDERGEVAGEASAAAPAPEPVEEIMF